MERSHQRAGQLVQDFLSLEPSYNVAAFFANVRNKSAAASALC